MTNNQYTKESQTRPTTEQKKKMHLQVAFRKWLGIMGKARVLEIHNFRSKPQV